MLKQKSYDKTIETGRLYLVPTPIGNLQDMTFRGITTLKEATLIASEDTRNTQKLLNHFEITTPQISFHEHNYNERIPELIRKLKAGADIAQVSDAGMPSISDPGHELVLACLAADLPVISLPGATAGVTALIASGLAAETFSFHGFIGRKKNEQLALLNPLESQEETLIFYESPRRLKGTFKNMAEVFGGERQGALCRELTKLHEEYIRGSLNEIIAYLEDHEIKGECCILVAGKSQAAIKAETEALWQDLSILEHVEKLIASGESSKDAVKNVAKIRGIKKQEVYKVYHEI
ncbi:16S rRNA (cytidine(1402)-2'-O)-methyltransferase [Vagococcus salmoninarum]|uniref:16S rRNA (cytidine(1402)-2'-O)-methyltransferase n=1 Tax=Vagococcus salmoninarum TaxID=2739 RepID=UPI0018828F70|nr:16S rRNA (cytidine(1402)-2'-O)-methyltransferase [Vagococcus salmoninarum]MBE9388618.1 16S rRNA (cytidine(1402)-2'-O)-methyltransferase [Vagococcus salmoninarum]